MTDRSDSRKIKLIEVISDSELGGGPKHLLGLLSNIDRKKFDCTLICPRGYLSDQAKKIPQLNVINLQFGSKFDLISAYRFHQLLDKIRGKSGDPFGPAIVHLHGPRAGFLGRFFKIRGINYVYTEHIFDYGYKISNPINFILQKKLLANFNSRTDIIIAVSKSVREYLIFNKMAPAERTIVVPNGIEKRFFNRAKEEPATQPIIGAIGQLNKRKGFEYLIRAMPKIIESIPLVTLEIIGQGEERDHLLSLITKLGLEKHVALLGQKKEIAKYLKNWDLFVVPSLSEPFGIVMLEAISAGLPVVASNVGGLGEIAEGGKSALLVPAGDSDRLAHSVIELLKDKKEYKKMAHRGHLRSKEFLWENIVKTYEAVFEKLVG